jgi:hypothetical protein
LSTAFILHLLLQNLTTIWKASKATTAMHEIPQLGDGLTGDGKSRLDFMLREQAEFAKETASSLLLQANTKVVLPTPISKSNMATTKEAAR